MTSLSKRQFVHSLAIATLPSGGLAFAIYWGITHGFCAWEIALLFSGHALTMFGISVGFHRLLSHRAFKANSYLKVILAILGSTAAQGPVVYWVANHRRHHQFADQNGDPHSPNTSEDEPGGRCRGFFHAHLLWTFDHALSSPFKYCRDLTADRQIVLINRYYYAWVIGGLVVPSLIGFAIMPTWEGAMLGLLWGGLGRLFTTNQTTSLINSLCHLWGARPFHTGEQSRNVWSIAILSLGESWHNSHHAFPASAKFGLDQGQVDLGWWFIAFAATLGLADDIILPSRGEITERKAV